MDERYRLPASPWSQLSTTGDELAVHDFLTIRLGSLVHALRKHLTSTYVGQFELTVPEWRVLSLVGHAGKLSFSDLVAQSTSDKAQVSRTVRALEERGLIKIGPDSETNKKRIACAITPDGEALYAKVMPIAKKAQAEVLSMLTKDERDTLFATIEKLQAAVDDM